MPYAAEAADTLIVNALTIDVEDYFHVSALAPNIPRSQWDDIPCRVEKNIDAILAMLEQNHVNATFFTLGWVAERYPDLVRRIVTGGHELASHGYAHQRAGDLSPDAFLADIHLAKLVLEDIAGVEAKGYRAPSFSIDAGTPWALDCVEQAGYRYSSSIYPIAHDHYGMPDSPRFSYLSRGQLLEVPVTTVRLFQRNWPAGGGGYFRLLPYALSRWCIRRVNNVDKQPAIFYFHPWELDPEQPRILGISAKTRFRHYLNLGRTEQRLRRLLGDFSWDRADHVFPKGGTMMVEAQAVAVAAGNESLAVKQLTAADFARWNRFVAACPEATFFHHAGWKEIIEQVFHHQACFLYAERGGEICGVLPLAQVNSWLFGNSLASLPFCVYGGVAATDAEAQGVLEAEAERLALQCGVDFLEFRNRAPKHADWPKQDLYVTFRKGILPEAEDNMLAIPRKQRAMVRKGIKAGLRAEIDIGVGRFFSLYADNVHRHGTPALPRRYFERLKAVFGGDCGVMIIVDAKGQPVSGVMSFYFRDEVLPYYAGDVLAARELAGNDFKYWELMRRACERGCKVFDYGRSKRDTGSFDFKQNWGFEPKPLHYEYRLYRCDSIPQNNPNNPRFRLFIEAWRRLPIAAAKWLGPFIVRNLG